MASLDVLELLRVCVKGCLATQHYVMARYVWPSSITREASPAASSLLDLSAEEKRAFLTSLQTTAGVEVKGHLSHKTGEASQDLVTAADIITQAVLVSLLTEAFPDRPFTLVGEEEAPGAEQAAEVRDCVETYVRPLVRFPLEEELVAHVRGTTGGKMEGGRLCGASAEALRRRVGVFIDPIDATNCFVDGTWGSPMTLIGIALDGVPVAAVVNRLFDYPARPPSAAAVEAGGARSLSYVWAAAAPGEVFLVHQGLHRPLYSPPSNSSVGPLTSLLVCASSTTDGAAVEGLLRRLGPMERRAARGAGHKQFLLVERMLIQQREDGTVPVEAGGCDVFVSPGGAIKKWDCCAPQAFLMALGGTVYSGGDVVRYDVEEECGATSRSKRTDLPEEVVATTAAAKAEVCRRLGW